MSKQRGKFKSSKPRATEVTPLHLMQHYGVYKPYLGLVPESQIEPPILDASRPVQHSWDKARCEEAGILWPTVEGRDLRSIDGVLWIALKQKETRIKNIPNGTKGWINSSEVSIWQKFLLLGSEFLLCKWLCSSTNDDGRVSAEWPATLVIKCSSGRDPVRSTPDNVLRDIGELTITL